MEWFVRYAPYCIVPFCVTVRGMDDESAMSDHINDVVRSTWHEHRDGRGRDWSVRVVYEPLDGRYEPVAVIVMTHGFPLRASDVRALPLGDFIAEDRKREASLAAEEVKYLRAEGQENEIVERDARLWGARRGVALDDDSLRAVADVYRHAWQAGEPVTDAVAETFGIAKSTASKRIMAARKRGFLGEPGARGGERGKQQ